MWRNDLSPGMHSFSNSSIGQLSGRGPERMGDSSVLLWFGTSTALKAFHQSHSFQGDEDSLHRRLPQAETLLQRLRIHDLVASPYGASDVKYIRVVEEGL
ncbi:hypothetical protein C5E16_14255 [Clavibacter michiganensis]|uniref:Uncharacterized protein n=1 Tax=Clavibacter michiganensis TaxID=28447 RepID=A0A2S5VNZ4_9MICO|nr:hypothetical protein C5E16_14255 [Clavibacter michiganensis]